MTFADQYNRRMASLVRAEAGRTGKVAPSYSGIALARRLARGMTEPQSGVDPVAASAPSATPWLLRA